MPEKEYLNKLIVIPSFASLLRIPHAIVCVNKMDLVNYDKGVFEKIVSEFKAFQLG